MNTSLIQSEIEKALEQMSEKAAVTEAILAKKIRENNKIDGKKKAGICLNDLICAVESLEDKQIFYSIHITSANDILLKKETEHKELDIEAKRRRQSSEKSISILTSGDFKSCGNKGNGGKNSCGKAGSSKTGTGKAGSGKKNQKRFDSKSIRLTDDFEDWE